MNLYDLFVRCLEIPYTCVDNSGDYAVERIGNTLYIYLEKSSGAEDWKNNLDFPIKAYKDMDGGIWYAHRGFLRVWKSIEPYVGRYIFDPLVKSIVTVGYSHGGALAVLCHEYIWYNRPELRKNIYGYGFGSPKVIWGPKKQGHLARWENFTVIRNINDIVTRIPPSILGYHHVGSVLEIGAKGKYSSGDAHRPESYLNELEIYQ
ncbi:MAG: hypothetical protein IJW19_03430 [Clostridia bacterium]|nr:hypothetical protein [Clostridia bacterium]